MLYIVMYERQPDPADPCVVMLQIVVSEAEGLQKPILNIFQEWLGDDVHCTQCETEQSMPDISGTVEQQTVLMMELKTDSGGNARAELLVRSSRCQVCPLSLNGICAPSSACLAIAMHM